MLPTRRDMYEPHEPICMQNGVSGKVIDIKSKDTRLHSGISLGQGWYVPGAYAATPSTPSTFENTK